VNESMFDDALRVREGLTLEEARREGQVGMTRAVERAGSEWAEDAYRWLVGYLRANPKLGPDDAREHGCPEPTDWRAWGAVVQRAARDGLIARTDEFVARRSGHGTPSPVWRSLLCESVA
jgi:hypothetical protein